MIRVSFGSHKFLGLWIIHNHSRIQKRSEERYLYNIWDFKKRQGVLMTLPFMIWFSNPHSTHLTRANPLW